MNSNSRLLSELPGPPWPPLAHPPVNPAIPLATSFDMPPLNAAVEGVGWASVFAFASMTVVSVGGMKVVWLSAVVVIALSGVALVGTVTVYVCCWGGRCWGGGCAVWSVDTNPPPSPPVKSGGSTYLLKSTVPLNTMTMIAWITTETVKKRDL